VGALALTGCSDLGPSGSGAAFEHAPAWNPPPVAPCLVPSGHVVEHWRRLPTADLVATKSVDAAGNLHTTYQTAACEPLNALEAEARLEEAERAKRLAMIEAIPDARMIVQIWLGSRTEYEDSISIEATNRERAARFEAVPSPLRRNLQAIAGSFAYVGNVARADALALAQVAAVRTFFAYPAFVAPAAVHVATALSLPEAPRGGAAIAVFDECADVGALPEPDSRFASASGATCLASTHGTRVSRLAFDGLLPASRRIAAGLTDATTDTPESIASPALWALQRQNASVLVQTLHTTASEAANDALDMLIAEAAYPQALVVRAAGNGRHDERVVHRVLGALDVGSASDDGAPLASMCAANATTTHDDVERPALLDLGTVTDAEGSTEGTSFSAPRVANVALRLLPSLQSRERPALELRARLLAGAASDRAAADPATAVRTHEDAAAGAGRRNLAGAERARVAVDVPARLGAGVRAAYDVAVPDHGGAVTVTFALVFDGAPMEGLYDPARASVDLDLRVVDAAGVTLATSRSFDDDQEVVRVGVEPGARLRVIVERAGTQSPRHAVLAWDLRPAANVSP
jgi:hypothetical protein